VPTYEYRCPACALEFEVKRRISEDNLRVHACVSEGCAGEGVVLIRPVAFRLKGSGWGNEGYASHPTAADYQSGKMSRADIDALPTAGPDGKLYDPKTGRHMAG